MKRLIITAIFCCLCLNVFASGTRELVLSGNKAYNAAKYDEALDYYNKFEAANPESPYTAFNKGLALYRKEDYDAARKELQAAALKTKDLKLEAKANYNLGNCAFKQAGRQVDGDLEKAIQFYYETINFYKRALDLDPKMEEAAYNLEITRLILKDMLDKQKQEQEKNKGNQDKLKQLVEKLIKLAQKEQNLAESSTALNEEKKTKGVSAGLRTTAGKLKGEQKTNRLETNSASGELTKIMEETAQAANPQSANPQPNQQPPNPNDPLAVAKTHVDRSVNFQELSENNLAAIKLDETVTSQESARDELLKAIEALSKPQDQQQQQQQDQQDQNQADKDKKEQQQQEQAKAEDVIDQEKENKEKREQQTQGGYYAPLKDW